MELILIFFKNGKLSSIVIEHTLICPFVGGGLARLTDIFKRGLGCPANSLTRYPQRLPVKRARYAVGTRPCKQVAYKARLTVGRKGVFFGQALDIRPFSVDNDGVRLAVDRVVRFGQTHDGFETGFFGQIEDLGNGVDQFMGVASLGAIEGHNVVVDRAQRGAAADGGIPYRDDGALIFFAVSFWI